MMEIINRDEWGYRIVPDLKMGNDVQAGLSGNIEVEPDFALTVAKNHGLEIDAPFTVYVRVNQKYKDVWSHAGLYLTIEEIEAILVSAKLIEKEQEAEHG